MNDKPSFSLRILDNLKHNLSKEEREISKKLILFDELLLDEYIGIIRNMNIEKDKKDGF